MDERRERDRWTNSKADLTYWLRGLISREEDGLTLDKLSWRGEHRSTKVKSYDRLTFTGWWSWMRFKKLCSRGYSSPVNQKLDRESRKKKKKKKGEGSQKGLNSTDGYRLVEVSLRVKVKMNQSFNKPSKLGVCVRSTKLKIIIKINKACLSWVVQ